MATEGPASEHALRASRTYGAAAGHYRFWDVVLGSGYRATVDALSLEQRDLVRESLLAELRSREIALLRTDVVFGTATRAG
jgi:hypothetical protein